MKWLRWAAHGRQGWGVREAGAGGDAVAQVRVHRGDPFHGDAQATDEILALDAITHLPPSQPGQVIGLWNNFRAAAEKNGWAEPAEPLYFLKSPGSVSGHGAPVAVPAAYNGRVAYEGELAVVIGRTTRAVSVADAPTHILGYTCANDLTAMELLNRDASFAQWTRAKSFDGFCPLGPLIETDFDVSRATLRTVVGGRERQNYALSDMFFSPAELVSRLSHDLTLQAGDVILCGTSLGVLPMKPGTRVDVTIDGIGTLTNMYG